MSLDDHVLEQIAETCFDRALVSTVHLEKVCNRALLADVAVRLHEHHPGGITEIRTTRGQLLERREPALDGGQLLLARSQVSRALFVLASRQRELRAPLRQILCDSLQRRLRLRTGVRRRRAIRLHLLALAPDVVLFDIQPAELLADTLVLRGRVLHHVPHGRRRVRRSEQIAANLFDAPFESFDLRLRLRVLRAGGGHHIASLVSRPLDLDRGFTARLELQPCGLAPRLELLDFGGDIPSAAVERFDLLSIEFLLLLPQVDVELASVCVLADSCGAPVGLSLLDAQACEGRFDLGKMRLRRRLALSGDGEPPSGRFDRAGQVAIPSRKQNLFPAPVFFAQPSVASRLRGLSLQRATLLFDFEHDVVDARQVLLGGFELQFCGSPARAVLRDSSGFFDQLAPICRTRTENHPDLALLDDRVGLGTEPGVHQELVNVAETTHGAVDQVLALPRTVQAPRDFDVASEGVGHFRNHGVPISIGGVVTVSVLVRRMELLERGHVSDGCWCRRTGVAGAGGAGMPPRRKRTSAAAPGFRASLPLKITSSILSPRRLLALCSPRTHVMASATLLLPHPLGPTMAVTP